MSIKQGQSNRKTEIKYGGYGYETGFKSSIHVYSLLGCYFLNMNKCRDSDSRYSYVSCCVNVAC
jgi:hypothetical protein